MVHFKKQYFVVQFIKKKDIYDPFSKNKHLKTRAGLDSIPLGIPDKVLANAVKDVVQQIHGNCGNTFSFNSMSSWTPLSNSFKFDKIKR